MEGIDETFIDSFCGTSFYRGLGLHNATGVTFFMKSFSPCFNEIVFVSGASTLLIISCFIRFYQFWSPRFTKYRLRRSGKCFNHLHITQLICVVMLIILQIMQISGNLGQLASLKNEMPLFEGVSYVIAVMCWVLVFIIFIMERFVGFELRGQWLVKLPLLLVLAAYILKLYSFVELVLIQSTSDQSDDPVAYYVSPFFSVLLILQVSCMAFLALSSLYLPGDAIFKPVGEVNNAYSSLQNEGEEVRVRTIYEGCPMFTSIVGV